MRLLSIVGFVHSKVLLQFMFYLCMQNFTKQIAGYREDGMFKDIFWNLHGFYDPEIDILLMHKKLGI
jgi:hypothetical protein